MIPETLTPTGTAAPEFLELELADVATAGSPSADLGPTEPESSPSTDCCESVESSPLAQPSLFVESSQRTESSQADGTRCAAVGPAETSLPSATFSGEIPPEDAMASSETSAESVATPDPFPENVGAESLPGSAGEHLLQAAYGTEKRARRFYDDQVLDHLNERMREFVERMDMAFIASSDGHGDCDASFRAGPPGFIEVLDERHIAYPEYRGNGVMASLGNISENPHVGILLIDFVTDLIGLHINGRARIVEDSDLRAIHPELPADFDRARTPERWVVVEIVEAYIHCRKHVPRMVPVLRQRSWGTDDVKRKGGDFFEAKSTPSAWRRAQISSGSN